MAKNIRAGLFILIKSNETCFQSLKYIQKMNILDS